MAVKRTKTETANEEVFKETKTTSKAVRVESPKKTTRTVFIPKNPGSRTENSIFVGINGKNYQIMTGKEVEVPEEVYNIVMQSFEAAESADSYIESKLDPGNQGITM